MPTLSVCQARQAESPMEDVLIQGWVRTRRDSKDFSFLELNDGSCLANIQVIADAGVPGYEQIQDMTTGSAVAVRGSLAESPGKGQKWEVKADSLELIGLADAEEFPLQKKRHSDEFLRTIAHLRPRTNKYGAVFRIRSQAAMAVHDFFRERGFFYVHTPIITGSDCEGAGEMFRLSCGDSKDEFFGKPAHLTVSGQLSAEALAMGLGRVYTFGPAFRAENSHTARHAAEFWMIEPEVAFADLDANMALAEDFLKFCIARLREVSAADLDLFARFVDKALYPTLDTIQDQTFVRLEYTEAVEQLQKAKKKFEYPVEWGADLQTEHERWLTEEQHKKPVIVYNYPASIKPFYMRLNDDGKTVAAMDVLVPRVGEIVGGSQREERLDVLDKRIVDTGMDPAEYWWYRDLRRFGTVPHAGFGVGFERLLMLVTGVANIRDVIPFPRTPQSLEF